MNSSLVYVLLAFFAGVLFLSTVFEDSRFFASLASALLAGAIFVAGYILLAA